MYKRATTTENKELQIIDVNTGQADFGIVGTRPMICNSMAAKGWKALLLPEATGRKTTAERLASGLKHVPLEEFRTSIMRARNDLTPTRILFPATGFKKAISTAALDIPGAKKTEIGRLVWVEGDHVGIYGIPELFMRIVRSADQKSTPDVRTRALIREWGCVIRITYVKPKITPKNLYALLNAAGMTVGVGDFRQEKGAGSYGQFRVCLPDDPQLLTIMRAGGRVEQDAAIEAPEFADADTADMYEWYHAEVTKLMRGTEGKPRRGRRDVEDTEEAVQQEPVPLRAARRRSTNGTHVS